MVTVACTDFDIDLQLLRTAVYGIEQALTDEDDDIEECNLQA